MRALILLLFTLPCSAQTVMCSGRATDCPRKQEIQEIIASLPAPADWSVVSVSNHALWGQFCERKCDIPAFTVLGSRRTYLDTEKIWNKSGATGLRAYLTHELGHILSGSTSERDADKKANEFH